MAITLTLISMAFCCGDDLLEKLSITPDGDGVAKTLIWNGLWEVLLMILLFSLGLSESWSTPWEIILNAPIIVVPAIITLFDSMFGLIAYRYIGVAERNTFTNLDGIFYVIILVAYHLLTGRGAFAARLFNPVMIAGFIIIIVASFAYLRISSPKDPISSQKNHAGKKILVLGFLASVLSSFFDGLETVISSVLLGDGLTDSYDYMIAWGTMSLILSIILWFYLLFRDKKPYNPFRRTEKARILSQLLCLVADVTYIFAVSDDALLGAVLWNAFPVVDIVAARILMKERLSRVQYLLLGTLIFGSVLLSLG